MIERNPITGDAVIVAPGRAARPNEFRQMGDRCPFCPGNEYLTPPEIAALRDQGRWSWRIVPNRYPALRTEERLSRKGTGLYDRVAGVGDHEVIVEGSDHAKSFDQITADVAARAVDAWIDRYRAMSRSSRYVCVFKNHGVLAGATIAHPHSQVLGVPFIPSRVAKEAEAFTSRCPLCELRDEKIDATQNYRWIAPHGSMMVYEQWIVPVRHSNEMREGLELASLLQRAARAMLTISDSFNWMFINFPQQPAAHWYVQLFPRLTMHAGFELGTGSAINTVDPRTAARRFGGSRP